jgi:hypothetical protein
LDEVTYLEINKNVNLKTLFIGPYNFIVYYIIIIFTIHNEIFLKILLFVYTMNLFLLLYGIYRNMVLHFEL